MLKFKVENQTLTRTDSFVPVADSRNYLTAEFEFSDEWTGDIVAVFTYGGDGYQLRPENGKCTVPWEVIKAPGFGVSLFCGDLCHIQIQSQVRLEPPPSRTPTQRLRQRLTVQRAIPMKKSHQARLASSQTVRSQLQRLRTARCQRLSSRAL